MGDLVNLPGIAGGRIKDVPMVRSVGAAMKTLVSHRAVTGAGDNGAWTVWRDDEGLYRCDFSRHRRTENEASFSTKAQVKTWLTTWLLACN